MAAEPGSALDLLWSEYARVFRDLDDLSLGRWLCQTLGQFEGKAWRSSHPLLGAYRLAAQVGHEKQIWLKRLVTIPHAYSDAPCCRAPLLPLLTRDVQETGLLCPHCNETVVEFADIPDETQELLGNWGKEYGSVHAVAHWDDRQRKAAGDYSRAFENAAQTAEHLLGRAGKELVPRLLELYPAVIWEDQDECLEITPEDVRL